ncbi:13524_t:CDS:2, partial [Gigaspora rosea]
SGYYYYLLVRYEFIINRSYEIKYMENISNTEDFQIIKTLQCNNINSIRYSEIKHTRIIQVIDYGVAVTGHWRNHIIVMKHISVELASRNNEMLKQVVIMDAFKQKIDSSSEWLPSV